MKCLAAGRGGYKAIIRIRREAPRTAPKAASLGVERPPLARGEARGHKWRFRRPIPCHPPGNKTPCGKGLPVPEFTERIRVTRPRSPHGSKGSFVSALFLLPPLSSSLTRGQSPRPK